MAWTHDNSTALPDGDDGLTLPATLRADLGELCGRSVEVPGWVDEAVLGAARGRLGAQAGRRTASPALPREGGGSVVRRIGAVLAVAAAIALVVWLGQFAFGPADEGAQKTGPRADRPVVPAGPADVNGDGVIDILDAYVLQRRIERARLLQEQWDLTGDGVIDDDDVHAIAHQSVRLAGGPRS